MLQLLKNKKDSAMNYFFFAKIQCYSNSCVKPYKH